MQLYTIDTGFFKLDGGAMYGVVPKVLWQKLNPPDSNNLCTWAMRCLLVATGKRLILIDTGIGNKQSAKFFSHFEPHGTATLAKSLANHGFSLADITDVLLTHLHFDHVGGAVSRIDGNLVPTFPNAIYWTNETHWQAALQPNARERASFLSENILPLQAHNRLHFLKDGESICPDFWVECVHGHTESMFLPHIKYEGRTLVYLADLIPSVGHIRLPYIMAYDMQPLHTLSEKQHYLEKALAEQHILFFEHDPHIACCTLQEGKRGIEVGRTGDLVDFL